MTYEQVLMYKKASNKEKETQSQSNRKQDKKKPFISTIPVSKSYRLMTSAIGGWLGFRGGDLINKATGSKLSGQNARLAGLILGILAGDFLSDKALNI